MTPSAFYELRRNMVRDQIEARGVRDPAVLSAMRTVPRHLFVPPDMQALAYRDRPLGIGDEQTISQPYIVAAMSEALRVGAGDRVLEVGTGSGYQAAVLAELCSEVFTIERIPRLAREAEARLARLRYDTIRVRVGDGALGWPEEAPFDGIIVTCGAEETPPELLTQLRPGRRMIIPVGPPGRVMRLRLWETRAVGEPTHRDLMDVRFVPLVR